MLPIQDNINIRKLRFSLRHHILNSSLGNLYMRTKQNYNGYRLESGTSIVVEGFPRSANTYAWYALRRALEPTHKVRGHTHAASNVILAVKHDVPTMLLLRHPDDAVASLVQQAKGADLHRAYGAYSRFHRECLPVLNKIFVASFEDVIHNFPAVVDNFYAAYELRLPRYSGTLEDEDAVRAAIDKADSERWGGSVREAGVARPSKHRLPSSEVLINLTEREQHERERAISVYNTILTASGGHQLT